MNHCIYTGPNKQIQLTTNDDGLIELGDLDGMKSITSQIFLSTNPLISSWELSNTTQKNTFPDKIEILADEEIEFPFIKAVKSSDFSEDTFTFIRTTHNNKHIENCFKKAKFTPAKNGTPALVKLTGLEPGYYTIAFKETTVVTQLIVHEGTYWNDTAFILKTNSLMEFKTNKNISFVKIKKVKHNEAENKDEISVKVFNSNGNTRAHIMTTNYISANDLMNFKSVKSMLGKGITAEKFRLSQWKNCYLSNRKLGDEFRYIFDRKFCERYTGNQLDRPQILLKRMKIRETTFEDENVSIGDAYQNMSIQPMESDFLVYNKVAGEGSRPASPRMLGRTVGMKRPYKYRQVTQNNRFQYQSTTRTAQTFAPVDVSQQYKSYLNFIKNPGIVKANLKPDRAGNISFTVPSGRYTNLYMIISDTENVTHVHIDLPSPSEDVKKRDLSLTEPLDCKRNYNEVRNVINLSEGDKHKIKDITSAGYTIIDSLEKVKNIQLEIAKMDQISILQDLLFLTTWDRLDVDLQQKKYASFYCNETNLFLYFKDRPFFERVVKPFIRNKHEKGLIDNWLLGNLEEIKKYASVEFFDCLNAVEKILLISILVHDDPETAKLLAERIVLNSEAVEENLEYRNTCFDAVINALCEEGKDDMSIDKSRGTTEEECKDSLAGEAEVRDTPPLSPAHGANESSESIKRLYGGKGIDKKPALKTTRNFGGKGVKKRNAKAKFKRQNDLDQDSDEIDFQYNDDQADKNSMKMPFQQMETPSEFCETHYYNCISINKPDLVLDNKFWVDLANHVLEKKTFDGFLSGNFTLVSANVSEIIFSSAFLDLPFR